MYNFDSSNVMLITANIYLRLLACENKENIAASVNKKRKHITLTLQQKLEIINLLDDGFSLETIGIRFNVCRSTVANISRNRDSIRTAENRFRETGVSGRRTVKTARFTEMEDALFVWLLQERNKKHTITPDVVKTKAELLFPIFQEKQTYSDKMTFVATNGWYDRFRKRYGLRMLTVSGERASADLEAFSSFKSNLMQIILDNRYEKYEIYNADESGLFFKLLPSRTIALHDENIAEGRKVIKSRVTFMPCCNIDGSHKLPLMLLGTAQNPRTLPKDKSLLPVYYKSSKKAWMNRQLFREWFFEQFVPSVEKFAQMNKHKPRALLLLDNCSAHHDGGDSLEHGDIKVMYLPPNITSLGQPMDQGVLNAIKKRYKKKLMLHLLLNDEDLALEEKLKQISLRDVINWLHQSWEEISNKTVEGSWKNLIDEYPHFILENDDEDSSLDEDVLALACSISNALNEQSSAGEIEQWLNDIVCDMNGSTLTGDCDIYSDQEIVDYVLNRHANSTDDDSSSEIEQNESCLNEVKIERFDEEREKHDKAMQCVEYLITLMEEKGDILEVTRLNNVKSKLIELEWKRRREA